MRLHLNRKRGIIGFSDQREMLALHYISYMIVIIPKMEYNVLESEVYSLCI